MLEEQRVDGLLTVEWERQVKRHTHYVGWGRGSAKRAQRVSETIRYCITRQHDGLPFEVVSGLRSVGRIKTGHDAGHDPTKTDGQRESCQGVGYTRPIA